jgi:hypothetical protein
VWVTGRSAFFPFVVPAEQTACAAGDVGLLGTALVEE